MAKAEASALMRADNRRLAGDLSKSQKMFRSTFSKVGRGIKGTLGKAFSPLGVGLGALGIASIGKDVIDFEEKLTRLGIQAGASGETMATFRSKLLDMSRASGISRKELIGGVDALVNLTGKQGLSIEKLEVLKNAQLATGASMKDLAGLAFSLEKSFDIKSAKDLTQGLSGIIQAGKDGAIPLTEMSVILQQLSASFSAVGGKGTGAAADLSAALQVLRPGFGSASEAGTGLQGLLTALAKKSKILGKFNIKVFEKDPKTGIKTFRGFRAILDDFAKSKIMKDPAALTKALGRVEAKKALEQLVKNRQGFEDLATSARGSSAVITDKMKFQQSAAFKLRKAMNNVKESIAKVFTPERIEAFAAIMSKLGKVVEFMVDNVVTMGLAFAGIKLASFAFAMQRAATAAAATAASAAATNTSMAGSAAQSAKFAGFIGKAAGAFGAFSAGFAIGNWIEKETGIGSKIGGAVKDFTSTAGTERDEQGFLRDRLARLQNERDLRAQTGTSKLTTEQILQQARGAVRSGPSTGFVETQSLGVPGSVGQIQTFGPDMRAMESLANAAKLLKDAAELQSKGIAITIGVDESGQLVVKKKGGGGSNSDRRQTQ